MGREVGGKIEEQNGDSCIHVPRQVEMADEQYFVQCGRMGQVGLVEKRETTKRIPRP